MSETRGETGPLKTLVAVERGVSVAFMAAIVALVVFQVVSRYVLGRPLPWTEEISRIALIWLTFVSAALVMARGQHIAVEFIERFLGPRARTALEVFSSSVVILGSLAIVVSGVPFGIFMHRIGSVAADVPMSVVYGAGIVGLSLLAFHSAVNLVVALRRGGEAYEEAPDPDEVART